MTEKRIEWIDTLKGIGIILVLLGHRTIPSPMKYFIFSFHMPLFFFISGYLFIDNKYRASFNYVKRKLQTIILPYIFFSIISFIMYPLISNEYRYSVFSIKNILSRLFYLNGDVLWDGPLWFLICLFVVSITFYFVNKHIRNKNLLLILLIIFSVAGYFLSNYYYYGAKRLPFGLDIALTALTFYGLGYYIKIKNLSLNKPWKLMILMAGSFLLNIYISIFRNGLVNMSKNEYGNYFFFYVAALSGILFMVILSHYIKNKLIIFLGKNTIIILSTHMIIYSIIDVFFKIPTDRTVYIHELLVVIVTIIILIPIIKLLNRILPDLFGSKTNVQLKA